MSGELLNCPFCGNAGIEYHDGECFFAGCNNPECNGTTPCGMSTTNAKQARDLWNRRTPSVVRNELLRTAIMLSDELHNAEQNGVELPKYVDEAWLHLSVAIENARSRKGNVGLLDPSVYDETDQLSARPNAEGVVVPVEPTEEMIVAAYGEIERGGGPKSVYKAMLSARLEGKG